MGGHKGNKLRNQLAQNAKKLIAAAVASIGGTTPPPPELSLAWLCGDYHLPEPGGIYNQEYKLMVRMKVLKNAYDAVSKMRGLVGNDINTKLTLNERLLLGELQKMGIKLGGIR